MRPVRELKLVDWMEILFRAGKGFTKDRGPLLASAVAYASFFAIPAVMFVVVGAFTLAAAPDTIDSLTGQMERVIPAEAADLLNGSLHQAASHQGVSLALTLVGFVIALWSVTSAMNAYILAINLAHGIQDSRSFARRRIVALKMAAVIGLALALVVALLILGPVLERAVASAVPSAADAVDVLWWVVQWPILLGGLLAAFATLLYLAPDTDERRWTFLTPGALVAALLWIVASGLFSFYTATFASYSKTWGALSAVIVTLTWLWLTAAALLFGAEIDAAAERKRES